MQLSDVGDWSEWTFQEETNSLEQFNLRGSARRFVLGGCDEDCSQHPEARLRVVRVGWDS